MLVGDYYRVVSILADPQNGLVTVCLRPAGNGSNAISLSCPTWRVEDWTLGKRYFLYLTPAGNSAGREQRRPARRQTSGGYAYRVVQGRSRAAFSKGEPMTASLTLAAVLFAHLDAILPPLQDLDKFPAPAVVQSYLEFNAACEVWAQQQIDQAPPLWTDYWWQVKCEVYECRTPWRVLSEAQCQARHPLARRQSLAELEQVLGMRGYFRGELPQPVPVWRFALRE